VALIDSFVISHDFLSQSCQSHASVEHNCFVPREIHLHLFLDFRGV
jgi:hypothetical protein